MADMHIKVKTEALQEAADDVRRQVSVVRELFEQMGQTVANSASYWEGAGNQAYIQYWNRKRDQVEKFLRMYEENADDLEKIVGVYAEAENRSTGFSENLCGSVIV